MKKEFLLTIELRYGTKSSTQECKKVTLGVFNNLDIACSKGNEYLVKLESRFKIMHNTKDRLGKNQGAFGSYCDLVTNTGYLKTPFDFYIKVTKLNYLDLTTTIDNALNKIKEKKLWDTQQSNS